MHGLVALDERDRVLRPAILWNDQRTKAECDEIEARLGDDLVAPDRQPRADRLHRAEAAVDGAPRARAPRARRAPCCCPRTTCACGWTASAAPTSPTRAARCGSTPAARDWSAPVLDALEVDPAWLPPALGVARRGRGGGPGRGGGRRGGDRAGRRLGGPGHQRRRAQLGRRVRARPAGARAGVRARRAGPVVLDGRDPVGRRVAALAARRARRALRRPARRGRALAARLRGPDLPALPDRRARAPQRPGRARRLRRPDHAPRPRRAGAGRARGRGLRAARRARPRRRGGRRARERGRRAQRAVAADRRLRARDAPGAGGRRRGRGVRRGAAGRRAGRRLGGCRRGGRRVRPNPGDRRARARMGRRLRESRERFRALYPALREAFVCL